ncbi:glycosyltransferase [Tamlana agarivorans]|uniref:Glycosyltransferase n=1 Tax=Pseudotamlana agarivorans TaxID=481183 RepID=A0ACC5U786_9FLAO|nr:glycosyltransferase [Tamlana agarivorans]MBU2950182.1 glycosyltransferase [Tamlana agarivorans]
MISILIPIYNYNAFPLVSELVKQASFLKTDYEIICVDDASKSPLNQDNEKINTLKNATFFSNKENLGYSSNRNFLVSISHFKYLLFIDGDSIITTNLYLKTYLDDLSKGFDIVYGGRIHPKSVANSNKRLRWKYGKFREDKPSSKRLKEPYKSLMFNNTLVNKQVFDSIQFDIVTNKYGHDDTLFAYRARLAQLKVGHIDNSIMHADIDENKAFLEKTHTSLKNLKYLSNQNLISVDFVKMLSIHNKLKHFKLNYLVMLFYLVFKDQMRLNLTSNTPSLKIYNLYRLSFFCYINRQK